MKKIIFCMSALVMCASLCLAFDDVKAENNTESVEMVGTSQGIEGFYKYDGNNWIKINSGWYRLIEDGKSVEGSYTTESDPWGGIIVKLYRGDSFYKAGTIKTDSNGTYFYLNNRKFWK